MSANLMAPKGSSYWDKNLFPNSVPASFAVSEDGVERDQHELMGETNPVSTILMLEKAGRTLPGESWSWAPPSSIQGGSSSLVPICDNQGVNLNPLNTISQLSFPLSLGMFRLFVSYLFLIIDIFITFHSSGFIWQRFLKFGGFLCWIQSQCCYSTLVSRCTGHHLGMTEGNWAKKWIKLSHPNGWVNVPWKPRQEQPERNISSESQHSSESRLITNRESGSLNNVWFANFKTVSITLKAPSSFPEQRMTQISQCT